MTLTHSFKQGGDRYAGSFHSTLKICLRAPGKQKGVIENIEESRFSRGFNLREKGLEEKLQTSSLNQTFFPNRERLWEKG